MNTTSLRLPYLCLRAIILIALFGGCTYDVLPDKEVSSMDRELPEQGHRTWAVSGNLLSGDTTKSVDLQTGDLSQEDYAYYTIQFGTTAQNGPLTLATITFTVNGNPIVRKVSVGNGVEISGPADSISVKVTDYTFVPSVKGETYMVTISIVPGTRASTTQALLGDYEFEPGRTGFYNVGTTIDIGVPQNAGVVGVWLAGQGTASVGGHTITLPQLRVFLENVTTQYQFDITTTQPFYFPLPPGVVTLHVENFNVQTGSISVLWVVDG